jgi:hypothetical protein
VSTFQIAQLNVAYAVAPLDSPELAEFMGALDEVNALAEASSGFVWRLQGAGGNATDLVVPGEPGLLVNMSVWQTVESLFAFVYRSAHTPFLVRRREWFQRPTEAHQVLWWVPAGAIPTLAEGMARLRHLREHGPSPHAFTFKARHPSPGEDGTPTDMLPERYCTA